MVNARRALLNNSQKLRVRGVPTREGLTADNDGFHGIRCENSTSSLVGRDGKFLITRVSKPVRADGWIVGCVLGGNGHVPSGKGGNETGNGRGVVFAVARGAEDEISLIS